MKNTCKHWHVCKQGGDFWADAQSQRSVRCAGQTEAVQPRCVQAILPSLEGLEEPKC